MSLPFFPSAFNEMFDNLAKSQEQKTYVTQQLVNNLDSILYIH